MAEIRKHVPSTNAIADAVRAALGNDVRPLLPGEPAAPHRDEEKKPATTTVRAFTFRTKPAEPAG